jgi:hypothetical protein
MHLNEDYALETSPMVHGTGTYRYRYCTATDQEAKSAFEMQLTKKITGFKRY